MADLAETRREERDFLLASLDDLEAEYAAGDLEPDDYEALRADYTTRAAAAIRAAERAEAPAPAPDRRSWRRTVGWTVLVIALATLAGVLVAEFSGSRGTGTITGDTRETTRQRLFEASSLLGTDPEAAAALYDSVLQDTPSNPEALAYRGWLLNLAGDPGQAQGFLEDAVRSDPGYPDARVFAAAVALEQGDAVAAKGHLDALDEIDAPPFIEQLVRGQGLRVRVVEELVLTGAPDAFAESGLEVAEVARAADEILVSGEDPVRGLELHEVMLVERPDDPEALIEAGWFRARLAFQGGSALASLMTRADEELTAALTLVPDDPAALVYRAFVKLWQDDLDGARADLAAFDALAADRGDLDLLIAETGLREELA